MGISSAVLSDRGAVLEGAVSTDGAVGTDGAVLRERDDLAHRVARARAALARAEEHTGTDSWVRPLLRPVEPVDAEALPSDPFAREIDDEPRAAERLLPVARHLAALLPSGALDRGTTVVVAGSTALALGLLAEASRAGGWVAVVGLPGVGVLAAQQLGLELDRLVLVPDPGADGPTVIAALLDGVDVVVVGPGVALGHADRRRLSARARERSSVLMPTTPWPGAHVVLTAEASHWEGLGRGHGRLRSRRLTVDRSGRGTAGQAVRCEVSLPGTSGVSSGSSGSPLASPAAVPGRRAG
jgi:hypothetical protein